MKWQTLYLRVNLVLCGIRSHTENTILRLNPDFVVGREERDRQSGNAFFTVSRSR